jgi:amidase/6-aminohexanoate-cyclic-dimer hydrolase
MTTMTRRTALAGAGAAIVATAAGARTPKVRESGLIETHDALGLAELVRTKQVSPTELLDAAIARTETTNPRYNFLAREHYDYARKAIARGLPQGPFTGVPWLVKDLNTYIAGEITGQGSRFYKDNRATVTSEIVRRHERAGLVVFGKTTTPEFGLTATTESKATGLTRNPWNPEYIAGGSSGGAAAAVAAGVIPAAHATDGGGSFRIPAACCGLFGLKPSRGRVPMGPLRTEGWGGLSCHHAVTRSVRDSAALLDATQGLEPGSRYVAPTPERPYLEEVRRAPGKLRIALMLAPPAGSAVDPECIAATRNAAKLCEGLGHVVEEAAPKLDAGALGQAAFVMMGASVAAELDARSKATGVPLGLDVIERVTMMFHDVGSKFTATDWVRANNAFQEAAVTMAQFMDRYDLILSPTLGSPPLKLGMIGLSPDDVQTWIQNVSPFAAFTGLYNQTGQPSMSVPRAMSATGLPIGIMFSARYGDEATLFRLAGQLEQAAPWADRRPKIA